MSRLRDSVILVLCIVSVCTIIRVDAAVECGERGYLSKEKCICMIGYYGSSCEITAASESPNLWYFHRVIWSVVYSALGLLAAAALFSYNRYSAENKSAVLDLSDESTVFFKARRWVLLIYLVICWSTVFYYAIDPAAYRKWIPLGLEVVVYGFNFPLVAMLNNLLVVHWLQVYGTAMKLLLEARAIEQINRNYQSQDVTLVSTLKKIRAWDYRTHWLLSGIIILVTFSLEIARDFYYAASYGRTSWLSYLWLGYMIVLYCSQALAIWACGKRLLPILSDDAYGHLKPLTVRLYYQCFGLPLAFSATMIGYTIFPYYGYQYILVDMIWRCSMAASCLSVLSFFIHVRVDEEGISISFCWNTSPESEIQENSNEKKRTSSVESFSTSVSSVPIVPIQTYTEQKESASTFVNNVSV